MDLRKENRKRDLIKKLLTDVVVNLCKVEVEYNSVLILEGTIAITSDHGSMQVVQIQEMVNKMDNFRCGTTITDDMESPKEKQSYQGILVPLTINTNDANSANTHSQISANTFHEKMADFNPQFVEGQGQPPAHQIRELLTRPAASQSSIQQRPLHVINPRGRRPIPRPDNFMVPGSHSIATSLPNQMSPLVMHTDYRIHGPQHNRNSPQIMYIPNRSPVIVASSPLTPSLTPVSMDSRASQGSLSPEKSIPSPAVTGQHNGRTMKVEPMDCPRDASPSKNADLPTEMNNNQDGYQQEDGSLNLSMDGLANVSGRPVFPGQQNVPGGNSKSLNSAIANLKEKLTRNTSFNSEEPDAGSNSNQGEPCELTPTSQSELTPDGEVVNCGICGDPYTNPAALEQHYFSHEMSQQSSNLLSSPNTSETDNLNIGSIPYFMCEYCNKKFRFQSRYNEHVRMHTKEKPFPCLVCHKSFSYKGDLCKHMAVHSYPKPYNCLQCGAGFSFSGSLHKHMLKVHNIRHVPKPRSDNQVTKNYQYECHICHKRFKFQSLLERHLVIHENAGSETMGVAHYQCEYCFKRFRFRSTFIEHLRSHTKERPFTCQHCEKTFGYKADLQKHLRAKHPELSQDDGSSPDEDKSPTVNGSPNQNGSFIDASGTGQMAYPEADITEAPTGKTAYPEVMHPGPSIGEASHDDPVSMEIVSNGEVAYPILDGAPDDHQNAVNSDAINMPAPQSVN